MAVQPVHAPVTGLADRRHLVRIIAQHAGEQAIDPPSEPDQGALCKPGRLG
jgi:hypothetical protein